MDAPSRQDVERQLRLVLAAPEFEAAPKLSELLYHLVTETLAGHGDRLKGYAIGLDVFGREPGFDQGGDAIVRVQMGRLRKLLDDYYRASGARDPIRILLARGRYAPRFELASGEAIEGVDCPPEPAVTPASLSATERETARAPPIRRHWVLIAMAAAVVLLIAIIAALLFAPAVRERFVPRDPAVARPRGPLVYVAQYEVIGNDPLGARLAEGLQFDLIGQLSKFSDLGVLGIETVRGADASKASVNPHGADFVLSGAIDLADSMVRITSQLKRTRDGLVIWSDQTSAQSIRPVALMKVQASIATNVASRLGQPYGVISQAMAEEIEGTGDPSLEDYKCVLSAYGYMRHKTAAQHLQVRSCLQGVTAASPSYATAWALLSWVYGDEERYGFNRRPDDDALRQSLRAAERAVAADAHSAAAHEYLAVARFLYGSDDAGAREAIETALSLSPNNSEVLADAAWIYSLLDGSARSRDLALKAIMLNPGHPSWYWGPLAIHALQNGLTQDALKYARLHVSDRGPMEQYLMAGALRLANRPAEADAELALLSATHPEARDRARMMRVLRIPPRLERLIFGNDRPARGATRLPAP